jgi:hypothetical protein
MVVGPVGKVEVMEGDVSFVREENCMFSENTCIETNVLLVNYEDEELIEEEKFIQVNRIPDIAKLVSVIGLGDLCVEEEVLLKE